MEFTKGGLIAVIAGYWPCMAQRTVGYPIAWVLHDATNIGFSSSSDKELGYLDHGRRKGVLAHHSFVVSPRGSFRACRTWPKCGALSNKALINIQIVLGNDKSGKGDF